MSRSSYSSRPDPSYEPYVSSQYGPNNHASMPAMLPDEGKKDWRARVRAEMEMRICIWPRSPSPPKLKSRTVAKAVPLKKESIPEKSSSSKSKKSDKSRKSDKSDSKKSERSERSSVKASGNNEESSNHLDHNETLVKEITASSSMQHGDSELEMQRALHDAMGLNEYEKAEVERFRKDVQGDNRRGRDQLSDDEDDIGPLPMVQPKDYAENKEMTYGGALMPGEGAAIAMYVQQNMRIPRRGEIGWSGEEINGLEDEGYVMSGSRHKKMNAVRLRKENQVYSAEEKRALALITFEEKQQKDNKVVGDFRQMLTQKLTASGHISASAESTEMNDE